MPRQLMEYHPATGFRFIPGLKARVPHEGGGYLLRTNASGFRCPHAFEARKPPGRRRVLLFGDSFTAGEGVSDGQRYGDLLETAISGLEVFNFGMPATGPDQHYLIYREFAAGLDHDLLVLAIYVDNVRRVAPRYRYYYDENHELVLYAKPYYTLRDGVLDLHNVPPPKRPLLPGDLTPAERKHIAAFTRFPRLKRLLLRLRRRPAVRRWLSSGEAKDRLLRLLRYQPVTEYDRPDDPAWSLMRAILEAWLRGHAAPVLLVPIPLYHHLAGIADAAPFLTRLREVASVTGALLHDPLPDLAAYPRGQQRSFYFEHDGHFTPEGHRAFAASLGRAIAATLDSGTVQGGVRG